MSDLVRLQNQARERPNGVVITGATLALLLLGAFLFFPADVATKTHFALHGLCSQRFSHSLNIGGNVLPLDARMTGIFLGAATTIAWLTGTGRLRASGRIPAAIVLTLAIFVVIMALDGINGLALDLHQPHPYEPSNLGRLVTGILAGTSLGVGLGHLLSITIWAGSSTRSSVISRARDLLAPLAAAGSIAALVWSDIPVLYAPVAIGLVMSAILVFATLMLTLIVLVTNRAWTAHGYRDLAAPAMAAGMAAIVVIGIMAALRLIAEGWLGLPSLT